MLACADSDARDPRAARRVPEARDIEITGAGLEEAFLAADRRDDGGGGRMSYRRPTRATSCSRTFRNRRFFLFSLGFPLVLYFLIAAPNRDEARPRRHAASRAPLYFMVGLAAFGTMNAMLVTGARIAAERAVGWNRQLRLTPLTPRAYFRTKVLTAYLMALLSIALLYAAGTSLGVRLPAGDGWR